MNRRQFFGTLAAAGLVRPRHCSAAPFPVHFRKASPYETLAPYILPGSDDFPEEKAAMEIAALLRQLPQTRTLPGAEGLRCASPLPVRYGAVAADCLQAEFDPAPAPFAAELAKWLNSLGTVRAARFFVLPGNRIRYEIASDSSAGLEYRVGLWSQTWRDGRLTEFRPISETLTRAPRQLFRDV